MLDPNRNIIGIKKLPNDQRYSTKSNTQGVRNPITINQIRRIVNFDSQYREILNPISTTCADINGNYTVEPNNIDQINHVNPEIRLFQPTNYTVNLNQPLTNVVDISLESVEIPNSWYVFSSDYGTNALEVKYIRHQRFKEPDIILPEIPDGYSLIIETFLVNSSTSARDPQIGITKSAKTEDIVWLPNENDDDSGPGLMAKTKFLSSDLEKNTMYDLWVGEYKIIFNDGELPSTIFKNEVGKNWKLRIKIVDTATERISLDNFTDIIIDGTIPESGVSLEKLLLLTIMIHTQNGRTTPTPPL